MEAILLKRHTDIFVFFQMGELGTVNGNHIVPIFSLI